MTHDVLFIPGPTEVRAEILAAMARPLIGHRSAACKEIVLRIAKNLAPVFGTARPALFETCPATALMEAATLGSVPMVELLLKSGANLELRNKKGENAWGRAALANQREVIELLRKVRGTPLP